MVSVVENVDLEKGNGLHNLRSGGATAAATAWVDDRYKKHGRWKTDYAKDGHVKENI